MTLFVVDDYLIFDNRESVELNYRDSGAAVDVEDADGGAAVRRAVTTRELATSDGRYTAGDVRFHLPLALVSTAPVPGDWLIDADGVRWTILDVVRGVLKSMWQCTCRALAVTHRLTDKITIQTIGSTVGIHGEPKVTYTNLLVDAWANVQAISATAGDKHAARYTPIQYRAYLEARLAAVDSSQYRVIWGSKTLTVNSVNHPQELGQLTELMLTEDPWPI